MDPSIIVAIISAASVIITPALNSSKDVFKHSMLKESENIFLMVLEPTHEGMDFVFDILHGMGQIA